MKNTLIAILRCIIKAIYPLVKAKRNIVGRVRVFFNKPAKSKKVAAISKSPAVPAMSRMSIKGHGKGKSSEGNLVSENGAETRYNPRKPLWKDKRVVISACAFVVIITVVLSVSLPGKSNDVYASDAGAAKGQSGEASPGISDTEYISLNNANGIKGGVTSGQESVATTPAQTETPAPTVTPEPTPIPTTAPDIPDLVPGCHDARILQVQERLMELDYMEDDETTDYYGSGTQYSLELFQRKHGLQVDGLAGPETLAKLFADDAKPYTVKLEDRGTDVELLQDRLKELGYLKSKSSGYFGSDTEKAVKDFQKRNKLTIDGSVGEMTREILFSEDAREAAKPKPPSNGSGSKPGAGSNTETPPSTPTFVPDPNGASVGALIDFAKTLQGSRYVRGGKGPNTFDCSGFVYYCLNSVGYQIRYMTSAGWRDCSLPKITNMGDLKPGDIMYFKPHHVGIYIGDGQMIDASSGEGKVLVRSCSSNYWKSHFICGRRVF